MTKLTPIQDNLLHAAAEGEGALSAARRWKTVAALAAKGLLTSTPLAEGGAHIAITEAGRLAIGVGAETPTEHKSPHEIVPPASDGRPGPTGKIGRLVGMLRGSGGTTIEAMIEATGWQAHSVRGAISGTVKKTLGLTVASEKTDGVRVYRIVEAAA